MTALALKHKPDCRIYLQHAWASGGDQGNAKPRDEENLAEIQAEWDKRRKSPEGLKLPSPNGFFWGPKVDKGKAPVDDVRTLVGLSLGTGIPPPLTMEVRRRALERPKSSGATPRRLATAERVLARERERLALFAGQVLAERETAEARVRRNDADNLRHDQGLRDLAAKHWREGRRLLQSLPPDLQTQLLEAWNRSSIPPDPAYFIDFVRRRVRSWGILSDEGAT